MVTHNKIQKSNLPKILKTVRGSIKKAIFYLGADLSTNIDLRSLDPSSYKHKKLKRKYKSVIENVLKKIKDLDSGHALYNNRERLVRDLNKVYLEQYN